MRGQRSTDCRTIKGYLSSGQWAVNSSDNSSFQEENVGGDGEGGDTLVFT